MSETCVTAVAAMPRRSPHRGSSAGYRPIQFQGKKHLYTHFLYQQTPPEKWRLCCRVVCGASRDLRGGTTAGPQSQCSWDSRLPRPHGQLMTHPLLPQAHLSPSDSRSLLLDDLLPDLRRCSAKSSQKDPTGRKDGRMERTGRVGNNLRVNRTVAPGWRNNTNMTGWLRQVRQ